eukprot:25481-Amphidinium_carterae.1
MCSFSSVKLHVPENVEVSVNNDPRGFPVGPKKFGSNSKSVRTTVPEEKLPTFCKDLLGIALPLSSSLHLKCLTVERFQQFDRWVGSPKAPKK